MKPRVCSFRPILIGASEPDRSMHLRELQRNQEDFVRERGWEKFAASLVFVHLIEEIGEIGRHLLFEEGYKVSGLGHRRPRGLEREFAQAFSLFLQLCSLSHVDLEVAVLKEAAVMARRFKARDWERYMKTYRLPRARPKPSRRL